MSSLRNAFRAIFRRWQRNLLTILAISISSCALVKLVVLSQASASRIVEKIDEYQSTRITMGLPNELWELSENKLAKTLDAYPGILDFGTLVFPAPGSQAALIEIPTNGTKATVAVTIATPRGLALRNVTYLSGQMVESEIVRKLDNHSVILGARVAKELEFSGENNRKIDIF